MENARTPNSSSVDGSSISSKSFAALKPPRLVLVSINSEKIFLTPIKYLNSLNFFIPSHIDELTERFVTLILLKASVLISAALA
jgi:hypothetical protein